MHVVDIIDSAPYAPQRSFISVSKKKPCIVTSYKKQLRGKSLSFFLNENNAGAGVCSKTAGSCAIPVYDSKGLPGYRNFLDRVLRSHKKPIKLASALFFKDEQKSFPFKLFFVRCYHV